VKQLDVVSVNRMHMEMKKVILAERISSTPRLFIRFI